MKFCEQYRYLTGLEVFWWAELNNSVMKQALGPGFDLDLGGCSPMPRQNISSAPSSPEPRPDTTAALHSAPLHTNLLNNHVLMENLGSWAWNKSTGSQFSVICDLLSFGGVFFVIRWVLFVYFSWCFIFCYFFVYFFVCLFVNIHFWDENFCLPVSTQSKLLWINQGGWTTLDSTKPEPFFLFFFPLFSFFCIPQTKHKLFWDFWKFWKLSVFVLHIFTCLYASWSFSGSVRRKKREMPGICWWLSWEIFPFILLFCIHSQLSILELVIIVRWSLNATCTWVIIGSL